MIPNKSELSQHFRRKNAEFTENKLLTAYMISGYLARMNNKQTVNKTWIFRVSGNNPDNAFYQIKASSPMEAVGKLVKAHGKHGYQVIAIY